MTRRAPLRALVTGARLPVGLELTRKLGRAGHHVISTDSFAEAPGLHSKHAAAGIVTGSPRDATADFIDDVEAALVEHRLDTIIPTFEEVFYLAAHADRLERHAELFMSDLDTLAMLHDKASLRRFAASLGVRTPPTVLATSRAELAEACRALPRFFARPAFSRGGVTLYSNHGPLAGAVTLEELAPTAQNPFLVQPYLEGLDMCSYSVVHHGRITAHATYVHPLTLENAGGIVFESVESDATLRVARRIAEATGYHGQLSFDFMEAREGLYLIECNPRPTSGISVMPDELFDRAVRDDTGGRTLVAPAGRRALLSLALLRNMVVHWRDIPGNLAALVSGTPDVYADPDDMKPFFYQLLAYRRVLEYRRKRGRASREDLMQGYFDDLTWDGQGLDRGNVRRRRRAPTEAA